VGESETISSHDITSCHRCLRSGGISYGNHVPTSYLTPPPLVNSASWQTPPHEVCKVRNAAVGRSGSGYSLAVFKKANTASARVVVLDASFVPGKELAFTGCSLHSISHHHRRGFVTVLTRRTPRQTPDGYKYIKIDGSRPHDVWITARQTSDERQRRLC
jgi:hypothetical protein